MQEVRILEYFIKIKFNVKFNFTKDQKNEMEEIQ